MNNKAMKNGRQNLLLALSIALSIPGQEILKLYTIFSLLLLIPERSPVPLASLAIMFLIPFFLVKVTALIRMRNISRIILHLLIFSFSLMFSFTLYPDLPFFGAWNLELFRTGFLQIGTGQTVLCFVLVVIAGSVTALRGILLARRTYNHDLVLMNFESGLVIMASIYFLRMGMGIPDSQAVNITGGYFLFALIALGASVSRDDSDSFRSSSGQLRFSLAVSGIMIFLILLAIMILLYPVAGTSARGIYSLTTQTLAPLVPYLIAIIRFLFTLGRPQSQAAAPVESDTAGPLAAVPGESPAWLMLIERILTWGLLGTVAVITLILVIYSAYRILVFLFSPGKSDEGLSPGQFIRFLLRTITAVLKSLLSNIGLLKDNMRSARGNKSPEGLRAFHKLCAWGSGAGLPREENETPAEYSSRLSLWSGNYAPAVKTICNAVQSEVYAGCTLQNSELTDLRKAVSRLGFFRSLSKQASIRLKKTVRGSSHTD